MPIRRGERLVIGEFGVAGHQRRHDILHCLVIRQRGHGLRQGVMGAELQNLRHLTCLVGCRIEHARQHAIHLVRHCRRQDGHLAPVFDVQQHV